VKSGADRSDDLSGLWHGFYNYPVPHPPTQFEATLRDTNGLISGVTTEEGDTPDCYGMTLQAVVEGRRSGTLVSFTKVYDYLDRAPDPVLYEGTIQAGGDEIEGRWSIHHDWSGTFLMVRARREEAAEEMQVADEVPSGR
jgi:hypothetical protein